MMQNLKFGFPSSRNNHSVLKRMELQNNVASVQEEIIAMMNYCNKNSKEGAVHTNSALFLNFPGYDPPMTLWNGTRKAVTVPELCSFGEENKIHSLFKVFYFTCFSVSHFLIQITQFFFL